MKLRKMDLTKFSNVPDDTRVLVTICIPEDNRNEMYTGTVCGNHINYDDGKTDFKNTIAHYIESGWANVYVLGV